MNKPMETTLSPPSHFMGVEQFPWPLGIPVRNQAAQVLNPPTNKIGFTKNRVRHHGTVHSVLQPAVSWHVRMGCVFTKSMIAEVLKLELNHTGSKVWKSIVNTHTRTTHICARTPEGLCNVCILGKTEKRMLFIVVYYGLVLSNKRKI